jgi:hypothetical protein
VHTVGEQAFVTLLVLVRLLLRRLLCKDHVLHITQALLLLHFAPSVDHTQCTTTG